MSDDKFNSQFGRLIFIICLGILACSLATMAGGVKCKLNPKQAECQEK